MNSSLFSDIDKQIDFIQQILSISYGLKEKCAKLEHEKEEAKKQCTELKLKVEKMSNEKCAKCSILINKLNKERKQKESLKKEEKAKLLKTIAKVLENIDDGNTNQMATAQQLFTQLVCGELVDSPERKEKKTITLIEDSDSENESKSKILVNETIIVAESEESSSDYNSKFAPRLVIPETEMFKCFLSPTKNERKHLKENQIKEEVEPLTKKLKLSPVLSTYNTEDGSHHNYHSPSVSVKKENNETLVNNRLSRSPSILTEKDRNMNSFSPNARLNEVNSVDQDKATKWSMKPSTLVESNLNSANTKKLKQMTLSLSRPEKTHDISLSQRFKGGVAQGLSDKDVILPSPDKSFRTCYKKRTPCETMEDPDLTVFNPGVTSTCNPLETSFDRLPEVDKNPKFKYRRDTVRKKEERARIPGQDCDQCAKYYEAAGLDKTQEIRTRMNACSRHRDLHEIRANTPPGFWDPVLPVTPEESQEFR